MAVQGNKYRVKSSYRGRHFKVGSVVVALESDKDPYCVLDETYKGPKAGLDEYDLDDFWAINECDLEAINDK